MMAAVHLRVVEGVAILTIDNAPLNLLSVRVRLRLAELAGGLAENPECRAVVISGAGNRAFSAGSDIREFPTDAVGGNERAKLEHRCLDALMALPQPVIAALHGHVLGGGLELALACDMRIVEETANIGFPEVTLGLLPCGGGTQTLPRLVGPGRALSLLLSGDRITAAQAERYGLVECVVPDGMAMSAAVETAARIARAPKEATQAIKLAVRRGLAEGIEAGLALEETLAGPLFAGPTARKAVEAFNIRHRQDHGG